MVMELGGGGGGGRGCEWVVHEGWVWATQINHKKVTSWLGEAPHEKVLYTFLTYQIDNKTFLCYQSYPYTKVRREWSVSA
jgi:hypothetical protein